MTIHEIVKRWLVENKYDGLFSPGVCSCKIDDLMPCDEPNCTECEAGHVKYCDECHNSNGCEVKDEYGGGHCMGIHDTPQD